MKNFITIFIVSFFISCSSESADSVCVPEPTPISKPVTPTPVVKYTLSVTAGEGGTVNNISGEYETGSTVTVTATPSEGYEFTGWEGSSETTNSISLTINSNTTIKALFQVIVTANYYNSGDIIEMDASKFFFGNYLEVYGVKLIAAGAVGGQEAVPDTWIYKTAQVYKLLLDKEGAGINKEDQENMLKTLAGVSGWHEGIQTGQRIAYGGGDSYSPNFLMDPNSLTEWPQYEPFSDGLKLDDMVWYKNSSHGDSPLTGDNDINEILEHILHTLHRFGVRGGVTGSELALDMDWEDRGYLENNELFKAMKEAYDNGTFSPGYGDINDPEGAAVMLKEYQYLITFAMWDFSEFWENASLSPEWNDNSKTPQGFQENNPLGYALYNKYFAPVISKPSKEILRTIFKDNDQGEHGYIAD